MLFIIIGLVIAAALIVIFIARGHESSSPLKTVESFKVGLEKISPEDERISSPAPRGEAGADLFGPEQDHEAKPRAEGA